VSTGSAADFAALKFIVMRLGVCLFALCLYACTPVPRDIRLYSVQTGIPVRSLPAKVLLTHIDAAPVYLSRDIAYRLSYTDNKPHPYADSRWAAPPVEQLASSLRAGAGGQLLKLDEHPQLAHYILDIELVTYDHVFSGAQQSHGEIYLKYALTHLRTRRKLNQDTLHIVVPAGSADAHGGVMALEKANRDAAIYILDWVRRVLTEHGIEEHSHKTGRISGGCQFREG